MSEVGVGSDYDFRSSVDLTYPWR